MRQESDVINLTPLSKNIHAEFLLYLVLVDELVVKTVVSVAEIVLFGKHRSRKVSHAAAMWCPGASHAKFGEGEDSGLSGFFSCYWLRWLREELSRGLKRSFFRDIAFGQARLLFTNSL